jgi:hypothetical protein
MNKTLKNIASLVIVNMIVTAVNTYIEVKVKEKSTKK